MRPHAVSKINLAGDFAASDLNDEHFAAVQPGLPHARAAIDGHIREAPIGRCSGLMPMDIGLVFRNGGGLPGRHRVHDAEISVALIDDKQQRLCGNSRVNLGARAK